MRPSNYQLFDFLDFNMELNEGERLWRACRPLDIFVEGSDVLVQVPFQQQENSNEIRPDIKVPQKILTLRLRAYGSAILRLTTAAGSAFREDSAMLERDPGLKVEPLSVEKQPGQWTVYDTQKLVRAVVSFAEPEIDWWSDLQPAPDETIDLRLYPDGEKEIRLSAYDMFSPARHDAFALAYVEQDNAVRRMTCSFHAEPDECFFGTGERFAKMDLSGRTLVLYNQDGQGVNNRRTYKNVPFYLSSEGYGLFLHTSAYAKFSLADHSTRSAQILVDEECLDVFLIASSQPERILYNYRCLTGFPQMPPLWSFGTWMSRMTYYSEEEVKGICERLRSEEYHLRRDSSRYRLVRNRLALRMEIQYRTFFPTRPLLYVSSRKRVLGSAFGSCLILLTMRPNTKKPAKTITSVKLKRKFRALPTSVCKITPEPSILLTIRQRNGINLF